MGSEYRELVLGEEFLDLLKEPERAPEAPIDAAGLGEELIANLAAQRELFAAYQAVVERQKLALVNGKLEENQALNRQSDMLTASLAAQENERIRIVEKLMEGRPAAASAATVKCEAIYPLLAPARAARLRDCRQALLQTVEQLKAALAVNSALVENGSKIIHATIGIMTSVVGRGKHERLSTYTAKGAINMGKVQVRNLINRSV